MSKFIQLYEDLFKPQSKEDIKKIEDEKADEWVIEFLKRKDIHKNPDGSYDVDGDVNMYNISFKKFPIKFNRVGGDFYCRYCTNLTSLEGAPKSVGGYFYCRYCTNLTSLEGAPKSVGGNFYCYDCTNLTSLEGAPKSVGGHFHCFDCTNLTSLEGAPKKVGGDFDCYGCRRKFTEEEVRAVCHVKGDVYVKVPNTL